MPRAPAEHTTAALKGQLAAGGYHLTGFVGEEGATSLAKNGIYNSQNVSDASGVNYGVLGTSDFTATGGTIWSNYNLSESAPYRRGQYHSQSLNSECREHQPHL